MRFNIFYNSDYLFLLRRIFANIRKLMSSFPVFLQCSSESQIFSNQSLDQSFLFYFSLSNEHFLLYPDSTIISKKDKNLFTIKILDFPTLAHTLAFLEENMAFLNVSLQKEGDFRFLKVKLGKNNSEMLKKIEIGLTNEDLTPFELESSVLILSLASKYLGRACEVCWKGGGKMKFKVKALQNEAGVQFSMKQQCKIKIKLDDVQIQFANIPSSFCKTYFFSEQTAKTLHTISYFAENIEICILKNENLVFLIREKDSDGKNIAFMGFTFPQVEDIESKTKQIEKIKENKEVLDLLGEHEWSEEI